MFLSCWSKVSLFMQSAVLPETDTCESSSRRRIDSNLKVIGDHLRHSTYARRNIICFFFSKGHCRRAYCYPSTPLATCQIVPARRPIMQPRGSSCMSGGGQSTVQYMWPPPPSSSAAAAAAARHLTDEILVSLAPPPRWVWMLGAAPTLK